MFHIVKSYHSQFNANLVNVRGGKGRSIVVCIVGMGGIEYISQLSSVGRAHDCRSYKWYIMWSLVRFRQLRVLFLFV